jgi:hypothetical protein
MYRMRLWKNCESSEKPIEVILLLTTRLFIVCRYFAVIVFTDKIDLPPSDSESEYEEEDNNTDEKVKET